MLWIALVELIKQVVWPSHPLSKLGRILGGLSLFGLIRYGIGFGLNGVFAKLFGRYEKLLTDLFGWAEPFINAWLAELGNYISWPLALYPHWKHFFVLLGIYFFREVALGVRLYGLGYAIFNGVLGFVVALVFSVGAGTFPSAPNDSASNFLIGAIPVLGAAVYGVIGFMWDATFIRDQHAKDRNLPTPTWWGHFRWGLSRIAIRSIVGLVLIWAGLQFLIIRHLPEPGVAMFAALILAFAFYWLFNGVSDGLKIRREGENWHTAYLRSGYTQLGIAMLSTYFWVAVFLVANAGL